MTKTSLFQTISIAACIALAPSLAGAAGEPASNILIVDQQRVLAESLAGQDMNAQAKLLMAQIQREVTDEQNAIMAMERDLEQNAKLMSPAQRTEKIKQLEARKQAYPAFEQKEAQIYQMSMNRASNQIAVALKPILQQIIDQRKAQIMLDRQVVMYSVPGIEVTDEAINRLNNIVRTVKVERVDYTPQGQHKAPLPAAAPGKPPIGVAKPK